MTHVECYAFGPPTIELQNVERELASSLELQRTHVCVCFENGLYDVSETYLTTYKPRTLCSLVGRSAFVPQGNTECIIERLLEDGWTTHVPVKTTNRATCMMNNHVPSAFMRSTGCAIKAGQRNDHTQAVGSIPRQNNQCPSEFSYVENNGRYDCFYRCLSQQYGIGVGCLRRLLVARGLSCPAVTLQTLRRIATDVCWATDEDVGIAAMLLHDIMPGGILVYVGSENVWLWFSPTGSVQHMTQSEANFHAKRDGTALLWLVNDHFLTLIRGTGTCPLVEWATSSIGNESAPTCADHLDEKREGSSHMSKEEEAGHVREEAVDADCTPGAFDAARNGSISLEHASVVSPVEEVESKQHACNMIGLRQARRLWKQNRILPGALRCVYVRGRVQFARSVLSEDETDSKSRVEKQMIRKEYKAMLREELLSTLSKQVGRESMPPGTRQLMLAS